MNLALAKAGFDGDVRLPKPEVALAEKLGEAAYRRGRR
jgi:hypothetical protein